MRRYLQFLFTVAMGAALLYLFAGRPHPGKADSQELPKETSKETAKETSPSPDTLAAMESAIPRPHAVASENAADTFTDREPDSAGVRTTETILRVIRMQTPALRHIYNNALRTRPGMKGKLVFKLRIAPKGVLADVALVSSTTGDAAFDKAVAVKVGTWRFKPISGIADDIVTVPFTFSE